MSRPGDRLVRLAARACSERTRRRLIDPAVADLQAEVAAARRTGSAWQTARTLGAGYVSIAKVLAIAVCGDLRQEATRWQPQERASARQGVRVAAGTIAIATVLVIADTVSRLNMQVDFPGWTSTSDVLLRAALSVFLVPSTLPITVPLGLALAVAWTFHGVARTSRLAAAAGLVATLTSAVMFANVAWLTPDANQAFRQVAIAQSFHWDEDRPLARGDNELTISALRTRVHQARLFGVPHTARFYETLYYQKLAVTVASVPVVAIVLGLAFGRRWSRTGLTSAAVVVCAAYYLGLASSGYLNALLPVPPIVAGGIPTALCSVVAALLAVLPRRPTTSSRSPA